jgi:hypothetical protein
VAEKARMRAGGDHLAPRVLDGHHRKKNAPSLMPR